MSSEIRDKINQNLNEAVKAQDKRRMSTLRLIKAALKDREIAQRSGEPRDGVSDADVLEIMAKMVKQRRDSITMYEEAGRVELAKQEQEEIDVISDYMPKQMSDDEIKAACETIVAELKSTGLKDMGRTMGALKERFSGAMDFGKASAIVKDLLNG